MTVYNYNLQKDISSIESKIKTLQEVEPFLNGRKQKIIKLKLRDLTKELQKLKK